MPRLDNIHCADERVAGGSRQVLVRNGDSSDERVLDPVRISGRGDSVENVENSHVVEVEDVHGRVDVNRGRQDVSVHRLIVEEGNTS